jgi:hypothetical protein
MMNNKPVIAKIVHPNDVLVKAPPAEFRLPGSTSWEIEKAASGVLPGASIDSQDIIQWQKATIRSLESDLQKTRMVTANIANAALCLYKMLLDHGYTVDGERVRFPKSLVDRMTGARIAISDDDDGNRYIRVQDKVDYPVYEGRTED